jgi:hypothetical protein
MKLLFFPFLLFSQLENSGKLAKPAIRESASSPLVDFIVLNDYLIKCLISFIKYMSRF